MKNIVQIHISKGEDYFVAEGVVVPVVTQGKTLDELAENVKEAVSLFFEEENAKDLGFSPNPSILASFELEPQTHARP